MSEQKKPEFNIFKELQRYLDIWDTERLTLVAAKTEGGKSLTNSGSKGAYVFSQRETLDLIELAYNSKYESGLYDSEGQRKFFLNGVKFNADVAAKMTNLGMKNYIFVPEPGTNPWPSFFFSRQFRNWARDTEFSTTMNQLNVDYSKYGTCLAKEAGMDIFRVPLRNMKNPQGVRMLSEADWLIEDHEFSYSMLEEFRGIWNLNGLNIKPGVPVKAYELYSFVPESYINKANGRDGGSDKLVRAMAIITLDKKEGKKDETGHVLFIERVDHWPYIEEHYDRVDGRWLGVGEVELQLENQIAKNYFFNMRRKAALWSSRKFFQSASDGLPRNLVRDVKDGHMFKIHPNGAISDVPVNSRNLAELNSAEQQIDASSRQLSFTFEVATGESLPSNTPYRLGVILSTAVESHFALKREQFGIFFRRIVSDFLEPKFKSQLKDAVVDIFEGEEMEELRALTIDYFVEQRVRKSVLSMGVLPDIDEIKEQVTEEISKRKTLSFKALASWYDNFKHKGDVAFTDESIDVAGQQETGKTILLILQKDPTALSDPNKRKVLENLAKLTGRSLQSWVGKINMAQPQPALTPAVNGSLPPGINPSSPAPATPALPNMPTT